MTIRTSKNLVVRAFGPASPVIRDQRGGVLVWVAMMLTTLLGMTAFVVDIGHALFTYRQLQAATNAAALAGAEALPSNTQALLNANNYSSTASNDLNYNPNLAGATFKTGYPKLVCSTTLSAAGNPCVAPAAANEVQVAETIAMPTYFAGVLGIHSVNITTYAAASAAGSTSIPYNIAVIIDTTGSMGQGNSDSCTDPTDNQSYTTRINCALVGLKILMLNTAPCVASLTTCPSATTVTNAVDMVSVFTFPNVIANTAANAYDTTTPCSSPQNYANYSYAIPGATTYGPTGTAATYQLSTFQGDFRTSDASTTLNTSSNLTQMLGKNIGGVGSCSGLPSIGGLGTYYAGALQAAQSGLLENQALTGRSTSENAIILLSDGAANATLMAPSYVNSLGKTVTVTNGTTYPSLNNECQQGVNLAQNIAGTGTKIFSVAYGATTNSGDCSTDSSGITPCQAMQEMASSYWATPSSSETFFSDTTAKGADAGCTSTLNAQTGLSSIFGAIANRLTIPRLIPFDTP
jgi:Flp pilus assembly protein TadG